MKSFIFVVLCLTTCLAVPAPKVCSDHGAINEVVNDGKCICESGFSGVNCENVIVRGKMITNKKTPVTDCVITVYDSTDISKLVNPMGNTTCDENGAYSIELPHRTRYVISGVTSKGTEGRQYYIVPTTKAIRAYKNRNRRSHESDWQNAVLLVPFEMVGEQWYTHIFWGYDHSPATCDLNLYLHGPYNGGCFADSAISPFLCRQKNYWPPSDHAITPVTDDVSCGTDEYGYEAFDIWEISTNQKFEIFTYNPDFMHANYQNFRDPYMANYASGVFANAAIYRSGTDGAPVLVNYVDLTQSSQTTLHPGPYWHIFSLTINTPSANVHQNAPGSGTVTVRNVVTCNTTAFAGNNNVQYWEDSSNPWYRGPDCPRLFY